MNTMLLILGPWLATNLSLLCGLILVVLGVCVIMWIIYLKNKDVDRSVFVLLTVIAVCCFSCSIYYFHDYYQPGKTEKVETEKVEIEKIEYEHHEYLIYGGHSFLHNPDCPCRRPLLSRDSKEK